MRTFRRFMIAIAVSVVVALSGVNSRVAGSAEPLVNLADVNPRIIIDLKYATTDNFMKQKVYTDTRCFVLASLARALDTAQKRLEQDGLGLRVYDGFRPLSVQKKMWQIYPVAGYVANPYKGASHHNRGAAVDLTLVDRNGALLDMPTPFDTFSERAGQFSPTPTAQQRANRALLRSVMQGVGLAAIRTEWWHYQLPNADRYPVLETVPQ